MKSTGDALYFGSGKPYDLLAGASNYYQLAKAAGLTCYIYNSKAEMLADGKLEKGDIILMYWSLQPFNDGADNHIGFDRLHDDNRFAVFYGYIIAGFALNPLAVPIQIVDLQLDKLHFRVPGEYIIQQVGRAMEGEAGNFYKPLRFFIQQPVKAVELLKFFIAAAV